MTDSIMKLLLGTMNPAKIADYKKFLAHANLEIVTLKDLGLLFEEPLEIGETFEANSLLKALYYAEKTEYPTLADDGGLEIDALGGEPGVNSKRWVGPSGTDEDIIQKVIEKLKGIPENERTGKFKVVLTVYFPTERETVSVEGVNPIIIPENPSPLRIPHFPYRSVMFLPKYNKFYAELSEQELKEVDHRARACKELLLKLEPYLNN